MRNILGGLALVSVILSFFLSISVLNTADASFATNGRDVVLPHTQKETLGFLDGVKNGAIVLGYVLRMTAVDTIEFFRAGFSGYDVFGSVWLRKLWWLIGIPVSIVLALFFSVFWLFRLLVFVVKIPGGISYYLGVALAFLMFFVMGRLTDNDEAGKGQVQTPKG